MQAWQEGTKHKTGHETLPSGDHFHLFGVEYGVRTPLPMMQYVPGTLDENAVQGTRPQLLPEAEQASGSKNGSRSRAVAPRELNEDRSTLSVVVNSGANKTPSFFHSHRASHPHPERLS